MKLCPRITGRGVEHVINKESKISADVRNKRGIKKERKVGFSVERSKKTMWENGGMDWPLVVLFYDFKK